MVGAASGYAQSGGHDQWSTVSAVESKINTMRTKQDKMDDVLVNLSGQLGLLRQEQTKAPVSNPADAAALAFAAAQRDRLTGSLQLAQGEFLDISTKYATSPEAPMSVFEIGSIYAQNGQYKDSVEAFDRVLEQFGENPMRKPACSSKRPRQQLAQPRPGIPRPRTRIR